MKFSYSAWKHLKSNDWARVLLYLVGEYSNIETDALLNGKMVHGELEYFVSSGLADEYFGERGLAEQHVSTTYKDHKVSGYIDLYLPNKKTIIDIKTNSKGRLTNEETFQLEVYHYLLPESRIGVLQYVSSGDPNTWCLDVLSRKEVIFTDSTKRRVELEIDKYSNKINNYMQKYNVTDIREHVYNKYGKY